MYVLCVFKRNTTIRTLILNYFDYGEVKGERERDIGRERKRKGEREEREGEERVLCIGSEARLGH